MNDTELDRVMSILDTLNNTHKLIRHSLMLMLSRIETLEKVNQELEKRIAKLEDRIVFRE
jgi:hypothetical protein